MNATLTSRAGQPSAVRHSPQQQTVKVLHVVNGQHYAGAARVQDLLALNLPQFGYSASFACLVPDQFAERRESQQSAVYNFPMRHRLDFSPVRQLAQLIADEGFALVHSHTTRSSMIAAAAAQRAGIPFVHHVHCQMDTEVGGRIKLIINRSIERKAASRADRIIAVSSSIEQFLHRHRFPSSSIVTIPNGVPPAVRMRPRRAIGQPWTIGMVALLRERKGLEYLLHAFSELRKEFNVRLRVVGPFYSEPYRQQIMALSDQLQLSPFVDWIPFTRDVNGQLIHMDALVLPSILPEGMPMVLLEAMSAGVPVVGSRVDGITDVIRHGQNGLLAEPASSESLATELRHLLSGRVSWDELRTNCLLDFGIQYSDRAMTSQVATVYDDILKTSSAR